MVNKAVAFVIAGVCLGQIARAEEDVLAEAMARNPARFEAQAIDLIAGFAGPRGLTLEGIEAHIALERAAARASAIRRFMAMDLDADGLVGREEVTVAQRAANASARGRMERQFSAADVDANGTVDAAEIMAAGNAAGLAALGEAEASILRAMIRMDGDGDGALTVAEVSAAVSRLTEAG